VLKRILHICEKLYSFSPKVRAFINNILIYAAISDSVRMKIFIKLTEFEAIFFNKKKDLWDGFCEKRRFILAICTGVKFL